MTQTNTTGVDWQRIAADLNKLSDSASQARQGNVRAAPGISEELSALGLTPPPELSMPQPIQPNTPAAQLAILRHQDTLAGLHARSQHTTKVTKLEALREKICADPDIGDGARFALLKSISGEIATADTKLLEASNSTPEAFLAITSAELRRYGRQLRNGRIAKTPYVRQRINEITGHLSRGSVVFIKGETGIGKTEVAIIAGRIAAGGREPLLIRGYHGMTGQELFGHMELSSSDAEPLETRLQAAKAQMDLIDRLVPDISSGRRNELLAQAALKPGNTVTNFVLGAVYLAIRDGLTLIIDEANYIPPSLLAKLNNIMNKKVGEAVNIQEDGLPAIKVARGFGIILTGNTNDESDGIRYQDRARFDLAFNDRIEIVSYNYLPQATAGGFEDSPHFDKQLFIAVIAGLLTQYKADARLSKEQRRLESLDNRCSLYLPGGVEGLNTIWRLCKFAAVTQMAFAGKVDKSSPWAYQKGGVTSLHRPDVALSPRALIRMVQGWKTDGFRTSIDELIQKSLVDRSQSSIAKDYLAQLADKFGFLGTSSNESPSPDFVPGRVVLESVFGKAPERKVWPGEAQSATKSNADQDAAALLIEAGAKAEESLSEADKIAQQFDFLKDMAP